MKFETTKKMTTKNVNPKNMAAAIALASALGLNAVSAMAETQPAAKPAAPAAQPAAAQAPAKPAPATVQTAAPAKPVPEAPVVAAEPAAAPETAPESAAAAVEDATAPAAVAIPEAAPAPPAKAVEAPAPATPAAAAAAPGKSDAATGSAAHKVSLGSVVIGADGKEVGTVNRVRTEASGGVTEIHVQTTKAGVISIPGNRIASGGQNVKLSLTSDEISKLPAVGGGKG